LQDNLSRLFFLQALYHYQAAANLKRDDKRITNELETLLKVLVSSSLTHLHTFARHSALGEGESAETALTTRHTETVVSRNMLERPVLSGHCVITNDWLFDLIMAALTSPVLFPFIQNQTSEAGKNFNR
jgi:hypothetical protein